LKTKDKSSLAPLVLEVLDRGPGIPPQQAERLKRPFTRLEQARSGKGGSGLGLAIVDRITRHHGGNFELLAREGGGLIARVSLPLQEGGALPGS
jgi:two-component system osmolarity sensor histidine kinase EnvZ